MAQEAKESFKVIGSCVKTQAFTWDERIDLMGNILYDISFDQDFSAVYLTDKPINELPISCIFALISKKEEGFIFEDIDPRLYGEIQDDYNYIFDPDDEAYLSRAERKRLKRKNKKKVKKAMRKLDALLWRLKLDELKKHD